MEFRHYEGSLEYFRGLPRKIGEFVTRTFLSPFPLHIESESPLDTPIEPVTNENWPTAPDLLGRDVSWPPTREQLRDGVNRWDSLGTYYTDSEELDEC